MLSIERFVGKVAVVTGASAGIGKAIVELLVKHGVIVAGLGRRINRLEDQAKQLAKEKGKFHAFKCDLTNQQEILTTFQQITTKLGPISVLINNAGISLSNSIIDGDISKWITVLDTNVLAAAIAIREAIASMKLHKTKGHIININSAMGHKVIDTPGQSMYPASKHAITALTETVRLEINREKLPIKITSLSPGYVKTEFIRVNFGEERAKLIEQMEMPGLDPEDVAEGVLYVLATPEHVNVNELTVRALGEKY
ncbi:unnamed protein product [Ceutorhynchus assimilis]|uniref:Farnesol dehydrogenase-like n=1 Tax=Ceutorhynchus assimilis TaxID=467358 RepID=A0A9N9MYH8_9CUCU|nr:unnamed protein product [Ceutorhynchus assimilis]